MRKCVAPGARALFCCLVTTAIAASPPTDNPAATQESLSKALVDRTQSDVTRIQALVAQGILPRTRLDEAKANLADAQDQEILAETLYGQARLQDMTLEQATLMVAAALRRVDRAARSVDGRRKLLDTGILAQAEFDGYEQELQSRQSVLALAQDRAKLFQDLKQMAEAEKIVARAAQAQILQTTMIRYDGNGSFSLGDLATISNEFQRKFHHNLPVSALGQSLLHRSMGLDHRNRVDIALNPDQPEGLWLRQFLERTHIPYLAFRNAVNGAATAPHIHIGRPSVRLALAHDLPPKIQRAASPASPAGGRSD